MTMIPGEVKSCPHCGGTGTCTQLFGNESCKACVAKAGLDPARDWTNLVCSACGGKGSVWVGPDVVQIRDNKETEVEGQPK